MKNYYEILEINKTASQDVIKAAYKTLVKRYHPDNGKDIADEGKLTYINEAYEVLSDVEKRKEYDRKLESEIHTEKNEAEFFYEKSKPSNDSVEYDDFYSSKLDRQSSTENGFFRFIKKVGGSIKQNIEEKYKNIENAYLEGMRCDDEILIRKFKNAAGFKKIGYAKALEEKGILERDDDGKLRPTESFRYFF